ncbi:MAG: hypothetical protein WCF92_01000 [bacterium]
MENTACPHCGGPRNTDQNVYLRINRDGINAFEKRITYCGRRNCLMAIMANLQVEVGQEVTGDSNLILQMAKKENEAADSTT